MPSFEHKVLAPLIRSAQKKIEDAQSIADITARTDRLVEESSKVSAAFSKVADRQLLKTAGFLMAGAVAAIVTMLPVTGIAASSLAAVLIGGAIGVPSLPMAVGGLAVFLGSMIGAGRTTEKYKSVKSAWDGVNAKFDKAVRTLVSTYPAETAKSSKLKAFLKRTFNPAASLKTKQTVSVAPAVKPAGSRLTL